jgi:acetolactate synthase I/II/III large subunit
VTGIRKSNRRWQSDVIVDLIKRYGFPYIALNPGASFRGLHDSLVNYGENEPPILLCNHEKIAVQIAHGYARATGRPMIAIVHDVVGLLHAPMGIYYAYLDRAPVFIIGATGPLAEPRRRPFIDWIHSANVQGEAIRNIVKWDYQPAAIDGVPDAFARAYSIMTSGRQGPVYMCYDAGMQEAELDRPVELPPHDAARAPAAPSPDPAALAKAADALAAAERPVIIADYAARPPFGWEHVIAIAETLGAPVWDCNSRLNFPSDHPLNLSMAPQECYDGADVVLALDIADFEKPTHRRDIASRSVVNMVPATATWIDIGFTDVEVSKWSMDYGRTFHAQHRMTADPVMATAQLAALVGERIVRNPDLAGRIATRAAEAGRQHRRLRAAWRREAEENWDRVPMTVPRLALEVWRAIEGEDWVLAAGTLNEWARKLWNFDRPYRHAGRELGTGTQIGTSLGVALANRGTGRLVVDLQPDGDLMYDAGALWIAAKYRIPILVVMYNNRAYYNDWNHQIVMARSRGTDPGRAHIGMDLSGPAPDFAGLARAMGWWAEGPIENAGDLQPALARAIAEVRAGTPALVDAVTQHR